MVRSASRRDDREHPFDQRAVDALGQETREGALGDQQVEHEVLPPLELAHALNVPLALAARGTEVPTRGRAAVRVGAIATVRLLCGGWGCALSAVKWRALVLVHIVLGGQLQGHPRA
jgi:hypothetical protein